MENKVVFWGVRGSIASPGPHTAKFGGNTSCLEVRLGDELVILDAGTGIRALGTNLSKDPVRATILFGHLHWDHIQGIPFFAPLYNPASHVTMIGPEGLEDTLRAQMSKPAFPVGMEIMGAKISFQTITAGDTFSIGEVRVQTAPLNHPGGGIGFRLDHQGKVVTYACDTEHRPDGTDENLVRLAARADILIYDAQYLPEEYPTKQGWGHSTFVQAAQLANAAQADNLVLNHHEPTRSDAAIIEMETRAKQLHPNSWAACEGLAFDFKPQGKCLPLQQMLEAYLASTLASG